MINNKIVFKLISFLLILTVFGSGAFAQTGLHTPTTDVPPTDQKNIAIPKNRGNTMFYVGAGYNILSKTTKSDAFLNDAVGLNLSVYQPFVARKVFTFGIQAGLDYAFSTKSNSPALPVPFHVVGETSSTVAATTSGGIQQSAFKIELGPQLNIHAGNHFVISPAFMVGSAFFTQKEFSAVQTTVLSGTTHTYTLLQKLDVNTGGVALTPKLRLHYLINDWIGIWAEANYTFLPSIKTTLKKFTPQDTPDSSGFYDIFQLDHGTTTTTQTTTKYSSVGVNGGLVFSFGRKKEKVPHDVTGGIDEPSTVTPPLLSHGGNPDVVQGVVKEQGKKVVLSQDVLQGKHRSKQKSCNPVITYPLTGGTFNTKAKNHIDINFPDSYIGDKSVRIYKLSDDVNYINNLKPAEREKWTGGMQTGGMGNSVSEEEVKGKKEFVVAMGQKGNTRIYSSSIDNDKIGEGTYMAFAGTPGCHAEPVTFRSASCLPVFDVMTDQLKCGDDGKVHVTGHIHITPVSNITINQAFLTNIRVTDHNGANVSTSITLPLLLTADPANPADYSFNFIIRDNLCDAVLYLGDSVTSTCTTTGSTQSSVCGGFSDTIPCCTCTYCDQFEKWTFENETVTTGTDAPYNISIGAIISAPAITIQSFKAELISFVQTGTEDCFACNKNSQTFGNLVDGTFGAWGNGFFPLGGNNTTHHTLNWFSGSGGTTSLSGSKININLSAPPFSALSCCDDEIQFCIRYSFTNKDCQTCSYVKCYSVNRKHNYPNTK